MTSFQNALNNTAPAAFLNSLGHSPALPTHLLSAAATSNGQHSAMGGLGGLGALGTNLGGLSVSTGSNLSLHQQQNTTAAAPALPPHLSFNNPATNSTAAAIGSHHGSMSASASASTMTRDFTQLFNNTLQQQQQQQQQSTDSHHHLHSLGQHFADLCEDLSQVELEEDDEGSAVAVDRQEASRLNVYRLESRHR